MESNSVFQFTAILIIIHSLSIIISTLHLINSKTFFFQCNNNRVYLCEDSLGHQIALKAIKRNLLDDKYQNSYKFELNALKTLQIAQSKTRIEEDNEDDLSQPQLAGLVMKRANSFDQEMCFLKEQNSLSHGQDHSVNAQSNIIQFVKNIDNYSFNFNNRFYSCHALFIEYAKNGCLGNFLESPKYTSLPIPILRRISKQLFQGTIVFLTQNILHHYHQQIFHRKRILDSADQKLKSAYKVKESTLKSSNNRYNNSQLNINSCELIQYDFKQTIGIQEMHSAHLVHRDIKEDNIVFGEQYNLKLIDLSFAGRNDNEVCGTQKYISPEILKLEVQLVNENSPSSNPDQKNALKQKNFQRFAKVDTFAAGVVLFRLATKKYPFGSASKFDYKYKYMVSKQFDKFWHEVKFILTEGKQQTPDINFNDFLHHHQINEETLQDLDTSSNSVDSQLGQDDNDGEDNNNDDDNDLYSNNIDENGNQSYSDHISHSQNQCQSNHSNLESKQTQNKLSNKNTKEMSMQRKSRKYLSYMKQKRAVSQVNCFLTPNEQAFFQQLAHQESSNSKQSNLPHQHNGQSLKEQVGHLQDLILNLLAYDVDERYGIEEALNHPFFMSYPSCDNCKYVASPKDLQQFFTSISN